MLDDAIRRRSSRGAGRIGKAFPLLRRTCRGDTEPTPSVRRNQPSSGANFAGGFREPQRQLILVVSESLLADHRVTPVDQFALGSWPLACPVDGPVPDRLRDCGVGLERRNHIWVNGCSANSDSTRLSANSDSTRLTSLSSARSIVRQWSRVPDQKLRPRPHASAGRQPGSVRTEVDTSIWLPGPVRQWLRGGCGVLGPWRRPKSSGLFAAAGRQSPAVGTQGQADYDYRYVARKTRVRISCPSRRPTRGLCQRGR